VKQEHTDFAAFWSKYPRRVARFDAMKAYAKARTIASAAEILDGVERYIAGKPEYADWSHPATWLNKGRWMDEYDTPVVKPVPKYWADECAELHGGTCRKQWDHAMKMRAAQSA
jgi:hypothetical protein